MKVSKVSFYLEKFWLIVGIVTSVYAIYLLMTGVEIRTVEYVLPIVAFVLFYTRRALRRRMEKSDQ